MTTRARIHAVCLAPVALVVIGCGAGDAEPTLWDGATGQPATPLTEHQRQLARSAALADGGEALPDETAGVPLRAGHVTIVLENLLDQDGMMQGMPIVDRCSESPAYGGYRTTFGNVSAPFIVIVEKPPRGSDYCTRVSLYGEFDHGTRGAIYDDTGELLDDWETAKAPESTTSPSLSVSWYS